MSSEERRQILQMVEAGKITADEAMALIRELEQEDDGAGASLPPLDAGMEDGSSDAGTPDPGLEDTRARVSGLWRIPLWIGMALTVLAALGIYSVMQSAGYNFWFYCLWMPFLLGVALMALAAWSRTARWLYVDVDRTRSTYGPRHIRLGLPLPLNLAGWFLRTFGSRIEGLRGANVDGIIRAISLADTIDEPLIVNVDDSEDGERVRVFIGQEAK